jgi:hypothetical protein
MAFTPVSPEFLVNTTTIGNQQSADIAMDDAGNFVLVWSHDEGSDRLGAKRIDAQRFNANGTRQGNEFVVIPNFLVSSLTNPSVAMDADGDFVVAWETKVANSDNFDIFARRYNSGGIAQGGAFVAHEIGLTGDQQDPAIAMDDEGNFAIVWENNVGTGNIKAQLYTASGVPIQTPFVIAGDVATRRFTDASPVVTMTNGKMVAAYSKLVSNYEVDAPLYLYDVSIDRLPGFVKREQAVQAPSPQDSPSVALKPDGSYVVAWHGRGADSPDNFSDIYVSRFDANGNNIDDRNPQSPFLRVNTLTAGIQSNACVATDDRGDFVVTWQSQDGSTEFNIHARAFYADGTPKGDQFLVDTSPQNVGFRSEPVIAMNSVGDFTIAWNEYRGKDSSGAGIYARQFRRNSTVNFSQATYQVGENGSAVGAQITLNRLDEADLTTQVNLTILGIGSATLGQDYRIDAPTVITFNPGETSKTINIPVVQDNLVEASETLQLAIMAGDRAIIGTQSSAELTILDDDIPGFPTPPNVPGVSNAPSTSSASGLPIPSANQIAVSGNARAERLIGTAADEILVGFRGSDIMKGGDGADTLIGVDPNARKPGVSERDTLIGNQGPDVFAVGNVRSVFYNDGKRTTIGLQDYALIKDFNRTDDRIQLHGRHSHYRLGASPQGVPKGIGIFLENGKTDELVAIVQGQRNLRLTNPAFQFVG